MTFSSIVSYLKKNYIIAGSAAVAIICSGIHFVRGEQITRLAADYDDLSVRHTRILKNLKFADEIDGDLELMKSMEADIESRLFSPEDLATNQRYFYQIESTSGVDMASIQQIVKALPSGKVDKKARKKAERSKFQELVYDVEIGGTYSEVLTFFREVEGGDAFAVVDGFIAAPGSANEGTADRVSVRVSFNVLGRKS
ncbi:hypothetical protein [Pelagicoccus mobilis]|uniref:Uncharacterized protein n=1 Tax=Pelagicoccus mobilis TaxID=415221 RepID=A0A934S062_9BACT|nr:hypothetical protein [Pelagicoccus mobilis]MBK1879947.1 hypothetical protein [Pelagicoccus mobilis]